MKPETLFRRKVENFLKKLDNCWHESIQQQSIRGTPDILCCIRGAFVALELKATEDSKLSALQLHKLKLIYMGGGFAYRVDPSNFEIIKVALLKINDGERPYDRTNVR